MVVEWVFMEYRSWVFSIKFDDLFKLACFDYAHVL